MPNPNPARGYQNLPDTIHPDDGMILAAQRKATGADIHWVNEKISLYRTACEFGHVTLALEYEKSLRLYLARGIYYVG